MSLTNCQLQQQSQGHTFHHNLNDSRPGLTWSHFLFLFLLWVTLNVPLKKSQILPELVIITSTAKVTPSSFKMSTIFKEQYCSINSDLIVLIQSLLQFPSAGITLATKHLMAWKILYKVLEISIWKWLFSNYVKIFFKNNVFHAEDLSKIFKY